MLQTYLNPSLFSYYIPSHHHWWLVSYLFFDELCIYGQHGHASTGGQPTGRSTTGTRRRSFRCPNTRRHTQGVELGPAMTSLGLTSPFLMFCFMGKWSLTWEIPSFQIARIPHSLNKLHHLKLSILNWLELVSTKLPCFCLWEWLKIIDPHLRLGWSMTKRPQMLPAHWCPMSEPDPYGHFIGLTCKNRDLTGNDGTGGWYFHRNHSEHPHQSGITRRRIVGSQSFSVDPVASGMCLTAAADFKFGHKVQAFDKVVPASRKNRLPLWRKFFRKVVLFDENDENA